MSVEKIVVLELLLLIVTNIIIIFRTKKNTSEQQHNTPKEVYHIGNIDSLDSIIKIIDDIIKNIFDNYQIKELSDQDNLYISDNKQIEIVAHVFNKVYHSISDNIINKLLLVYNKEYIEDMIVQKVQQVVLAYAIEVNGNYKK